MGRELSDQVDPSDRPTAYYGNNALIFREFFLYAAEFAITNVGKTID